LLIPGKNEEKRVSFNLRKEGEKGVWEEKVQPILGRAKKEKNGKRSNPRSRRGGKDG